MLKPDEAVTRESDWQQTSTYEESPVTSATGEAVPDKSVGVHLALAVGQGEHGEQIVRAAVGEEAKAMVRGAQEHGLKIESDSARLRELLREKGPDSNIPWKIYELMAEVISFAQEVDEEYGDCLNGLAPGVLAAEAARASSREEDEEVTDNQAEEVPAPLGYSRKGESVIDRRSAYVELEAEDYSPFN